MIRDTSLKGVWASLTTSCVVRVIWTRLIDHLLSSVVM